MLGNLNGQAACQSQWQAGKTEQRQLKSDHDEHKLQWVQMQAVAVVTILNNTGSSPAMLMFCHSTMCSEWNLPWQVSTSVPETAWETLFWELVCVWMKQTAEGLMVTQWNTHAHRTHTLTSAKHNSLCTPVSKKDVSGDSFTPGKDWRARGGAGGG